MSRFGNDRRAFFDSVYRGTSPWDVGGPQPSLVALLGEYPPASPVLDVGCGSGDLAIHLARAGLDVLGVDFSERAIAQARMRAQRVQPGTAGSLDFVVADALRPALLHRRFGTVVDSGFLHVLDPGDRDRFVDELASALLPGGRYYVLGYRERRRWLLSRRGISEEVLRTRFTAEQGWHIHAIRQAEFQTVRKSMPAICACIERLATAGA